MPTKNLTVMITDIKGFTAHTSEQTREGLTDYIRKHEKLLLPVFKYFTGTVIKNLGDAFLVTFESPTDAVLCGMTVQEVLRQHNAFTEDKEKLTVRIAINAGEVELKDGDIFGEAVNITSRLEGIAEAGEVYFTEAVYQTMNRKEAPSSSIGEKTFKGIPFPVRVYKVIQEPRSDVHDRLSEAVRLTDGGPVIKGLTTARPETPVWKKAVFLLLAAVITAAAAGAILVFMQNPDRKIIEQADHLMAGGENSAAIELIDRSLVKARDPLVLHAKALEAAEAHLEYLLSNRFKKEALVWLKKIIGEKPYLEKLSARVPALETEVTVTRLITSGIHQNKVWKEVRSLLAKYPKNADVPYVAATVLQKKYIVGVTIWLFRRAVKRGKYHNDERIFESCIETLRRNSPRGSYTRDAHELLGNYFKDRSRAWARREISEGTGYAFMNAWHILRERHDPMAEDSFLKSLYTVTQGKEVDKALEAITSEQNTARIQHAEKVLEEALRESAIKPDVKKKIRSVLEKLNKKN